MENLKVINFWRFNFLTHGSVKTWDVRRIRQSRLVSRDEKQTHHGAILDQQKHVSLFLDEVGFICCAAERLISSKKYRHVFLLIRDCPHNLSFETDSSFSFSYNSKYFTKKISRWIIQIENALLTTIYSFVNCKQCSLRVISGSLTKQTRKRGTWPSLHVASGLHGQPLRPK